MADTTVSNVNDNKTNLITKTNSYITDIRRLLEEPAAKRALPTVVALLVAFIGIIIFITMREPAKTTLFSSLTEGDKAKVVESLRQKGIDVSLDTATGEVLVPSTDYYQSKMLLAAEGLPESLPSGYDNLSDLPMGTSRSVEAVKIRQSQESELARSINEISGILGARVHLAIPDKSVFVRERGNPTASVFVKLGAGRSLGENQVRAIVHLVSSSVPNLPSENVTVVDQHGNLLSRPTNDPTSALSNRQLEYTMKLEQVYRQRVISLLTPILGAGNITAQVNVDVDFTTQNVTEEIVDPEGTALRSEQATQDLTSEPEAVGIPGAVANTPPVAADLATGAPESAPAGSKIKSQSSSSIKNYEVSKRVTAIRNPTGQIKRIVAAILVRDKLVLNELGENVLQKLSDEEKGNIEALVRDAIGFKQERGDSITISSGEFIDEIELSTVPWYENSAIRELLGKLFTILILAIVIFGALKPLLNRILVPVGGAIADGGTGAVALDEDEEEEDKIEVQEGESLEDIKAKLKPKKSAISPDMLDTANTYDDKVAVIRMIVGDEAGRVSSVFKALMKQGNKKEAEEN
ncbi:MAG: Flagellar M-ring protein [Alphaproteobacteria bacterium MarineAlpha9_Bin4]|nr:flagellar M-ring protein FliF [Pelagibacterales bacterium]PPR26881.1 MAG: Flagellar M-ring protein [Alphaproteobacteria bacterium MarineAlpha9_Bin4]